MSYVYDEFLETVTEVASGKIVYPHNDAADPDAMRFLQWYRSGNRPEIITSENSRKLANKWNEIKAERDKRLVAGVKVGTYWFHSDQISRGQQLALLIAGDNIPPGLQWKTMVPGNGLFNARKVNMTKELATQIFLASIVHETTIHAVADFHKQQMLSSEDPENYDYSKGWPLTFTDEYPI